MARKQATNLRLSVEARRLLVALGEKLGLTMTSVIELAIRRLAQAEGIK